MLLVNNHINITGRTNNGIARNQTEMTILDITLTGASSPRKPEIRSSTML